jgi:hypothetical protein
MYRELVSQRDILEKYMYDLEVDLVHKIKSAIPLNKNITPADADSLKAKVLNMLKTKKKQENRKD